MSSPSLAADEDQVDNPAVSALDEATPAAEEDTETESAADEPADGEEVEENAGGEPADASTSAAEEAPAREEPASPRRAGAEVTPQRFADGGTGRYQGSIDWFEWANHGQQIPNGTTVTNTRTIAGQELVTSCTISALNGEIFAYRSGSFTGDGLDDMYNIGGTGSDNRLIAGLSTRNGAFVDFDFDCTVTRDGDPVPIAGLVIADAEASVFGNGQGEYVQATAPAGATWRIIDRYRANTCGADAMINRTGQTLRFNGSTSPLCDTYPTAVGFMEGASSAEVAIQGGGVSAIALGVVLFTDFGDAPESYGDAGAIFAPGFTGSAVPEGESRAFQGTTLATPSQPATRLGATVTSEEASQPSPAAGADGGDDGIAAPGQISVVPGSTHSQTVTCTGPGDVAGWVDWDGNGVFDADEIAGPVECAGGSAQLEWEVPADVVGGPSFMRLRISTDDEVNSPTGVTTDGEVEDYSATIIVPTPFDCAPGAYGTLFQSAPLDIFAVDLVTGQSNEVASDVSPANVNATGYNPIDDYMYGVSYGAAGNQSIMQIGANWSMRDLGRPTNWASFPGIPAAWDGSAHIGEFDADGFYWISNATYWAQIDLSDPASPTYMQVVDAGTLALPDGWNLGWDWGYNVEDGNLYTVAPNRPVTNPRRFALVRFDTTTHAMSVVGAPLGAVRHPNGENATAFGAVYSDPDGFLYASDNTTGGIWRIDMGTATRAFFAEGPASSTNDGARCFNSPLPIDFGDAPNSYGTDLAADGPRHSIVNYDALAGTSSVMLGASIDAETDGQPSPAADGDGADEDGVEFNSALGYPNPTLRTGLDATSLQPVENTLDVTASADGFVSVWVDWNMDGDFDDAGERVANAQAVTAGDNEITFARGDNPPGIETYVRVRYSTDAAAIATPRGAAPDGEVEDYQVLVERLVQPDSCVVGDVDYYAFTFNHPDRTGAGEVGSTARYRNVSVINGVPVDMFAEVVAGTMATGPTFPNGFTKGSGSVMGVDDAQWQVDRDATIRYSFFEAGTTTPVDANAVFTVNDMDGGASTEIATFAAADLAGYAVTQGSAVSITEEGPNVSFAGNGNWNGDPESRFQVVLEGTDTFEVRWQGGSSSGFGFDGDGDLSIDPPACSDFGDAPDSYGTTVENDGPRHQIIPGLLLGTAIDFDPDGQPTAGADGDDTNRIADEDGVEDPIVVTVGDETTVSVTATNDTDQPATLAGWIDLNNDGVFGNGAERVTVTVPANSGTATYDLVFPAGTPTGDTFARFRLFPADVTDPLPTGPAGGGEVEDYPVTVVERELEIEKASDATAGTRVGDTVTYTVRATNTGSAAYTLEDPAVVIDDLAGVLDDAAYNDDAFAQIGLLPVAAPSREGSLLSWTGALAPGQTVEITYSVTLVAGGDGVVRNVVFAGDCDPAADPACENETPECEENDPSCDEELFELPRLTIEKSVDPTTLGAVGETLTYTVVATNVGPGVYTADAPAYVVDDLTAVLDDADLDVDSIEADLGDTPTYDEPRITWSGALGVDESVTITYEVTYTAAGDTELVNTAFGPNDPDEETPDCPNVDGIPCDEVRVPGPELEDYKTVNPAKGTAVAAGDELTYTLTFDNDGRGEAVVDRVDDLTHILDDATVTSAPVLATGSGLVVSEIIDGRFSITGELAPGATATITYTVTVNADGERGDNVLGNFLMDPGSPPPGDPLEDCEADDPDCTVNPIGELEDFKSVTPAKGSTVAAGDELTYTLTFRNNGEGVVDVDRVDDLSHVLDDAAVTTAPVASDTALSVSEIAGGRFAITGELAAGQEVTVTYTVTVAPNGERGDDILGNFLMNPGEEPPEDPVCAEDDPDCTVNPIGELEDFKSVDPAKGTTVAAGDELTYTLTFRNNGEGVVDVDRVDDLSHVLDDAAVTTAPVASDTALSVSEIADGRFAITGELAAGQEVTVTYTVTVAPNGERGDNVLGNFLMDPGTPPPGDPLEDCEADDPDCTVNPIGELEDFKSVDPAKGTTVAAGDELTYTLTFRNNGEGVVDVDRVDDLTHVLDDATVTVAPALATGSGLTVSEIADGRFAITGELGAGQEVTVTYTVTVNANGERGDDVLGNFLMDPGTPPPGDPLEDCEADDPDCTVNPIGELEDFKSVDPAKGTTVAAGDELTYTLTFRNNGEGVVDVDRVDDLSHVLDDAEVTSVPVSSDAALTVSEIADGRFAVTGELGAGQEVTVTYTVTVNANGERGDNVLGNFLMDPGSPPPGDPLEDCAADDPDCTVNPVGELEDFKSVDPAKGSTVAAGDELTYTLTFRNNGEGTVVVDRVDDLSHVLDDAAVTTAPVASDAALSVSEIADGRFAVTGELGAGQEVTVTYTVTVNANGERGDNVLGNFLMDPGSPPPGDPLEDCAADDPDCTVNPVGELEDFKSVDPARGTTVAAGDELTYTLTFRNNGEGTVVVDRVDDLTHVLDDADVISEPVVSEDALSVLRTGNRLAVTGQLTAGQTVTVTYTVRVKSDGQRGDNILGNFLMNPGEEPPEDPVCAEDDPDCTSNPVRELSIEKSADTTELPRVGQTVTYTVVATNIGTGDYTADNPAHVVDDLRAVLDDADLVAGSIAADRGDVPTYAEPRITWSGALPVGESVTITYQVTYTAAGDKELINVAFGPRTPGDETPDCPNEDGIPCDEVNIPGADLEASKSVNPTSGTSVKAGQELTYTLTFDNDGRAAAAVDHIDYLTRVLDDAEIVAGPTAQGPLTAELDGEQILIGGTVPAGATRTVTYTVQVKADGQRGDNRLGNFLMTPDEEPPGPDTVCEPGSTLCTENPVGEIDPSKSVDPKSGTKVEAGDELTYTLSFTNTGEGDADVEYADWLGDVLDDAKIVERPSTSDPALTARRVGDKLHVRGTLAPGQTETVTYTVKVKGYQKQGDHQLLNFLVPGEETPPKKCVEGSDLCTENPIDPPDKSSTDEPKDPRDPDVPFLPKTGAGQFGLALGVAALLLITGGYLVARNRRREEESAELQA